MGFSHAITERVQTDDHPIEKIRSITGTGRVGVNESIADSTTDGLIAFALDVSQLTSIVLLSDYAVTLETNDGTTPTETLNLSAGIPVMWDSGKPAGDKPFSSDITALYVTNSSGSAAQLDIDAIYDSTP